MDMEELDDLFDDDDAEVCDHIHNLRTYTVKERKNHYQETTEDEFLNRFRFTKNIAATVILPQIENLLTHDTFQYHELDPMNQLLLTLRFYATGSFYITMGDFVGIYKTTAGRIIKRVTEALITLRPQYIKMPQNEEGRRTICEGFYQLAQFPQVVGAIDCTHIKIQSPGGPNVEVFRNRKGFFSLNVQVVCDSKNIILDIVTRWPGSTHDSRIFQNSSIRRRFEMGEFGEAVLLGDSGYPLRNYLMTPLANVHTRAEQRYNSSHISTRTVIERTFGILKRKFPVLSLGIRCSLVLTQQIIIATAILHNIAKQNGDDKMLFPFNEEFEGVPIDNINPNINIVQQRYLNYFATLP